jgi:hypothetical protein
MAALDLAIGLGITSRNLPVDCPEVPQVGRKLRAMVRLDALDRIGRRRRTSSTKSVANSMVSIDAEHAIRSGLIYDGVDRLLPDVDLAGTASGSAGWSEERHRPGGIAPERG